MSASLVGSEMCIRDRSSSPSLMEWVQLAWPLTWRCATIGAPPCSTLPGTWSAIGGSRTGLRVTGCDGRM
eukprot:3584621-Alexandrium_andersonii.AAC.1